MSIALITGSAGLVGSEAARYFADKGMEIVGIDNDMRSSFFGPDASTAWNRKALEADLPLYRHEAVDIRDASAIERIFQRYGRNLALVVHTAAQPSHDWAARDPETDFTINANGTLNLLEATRRHAPEAVFIFTSTNKVYGDAPNRLPLVELPTRWELPEDHAFYDGISEEMSIDQSTHSLFGASKIAADILVQEYGRYFGMSTAAFRGGCLTGPNHSGTALHGFLAYLMKCAATGASYTIFGYKGKQVRDNIHSSDLVAAFHEFFLAPRPGEVYNIGGGRTSNCSMLEAIRLCEEITGREFRHEYSDGNRIGDHIWYVSGLDRFRSHYPQWAVRYGVEQTLRDIYESNRNRWSIPTRHVA